MKIQEKIWVVLDGNGSPMTAKPTREKARKMKKTLESLDGLVKAVYGTQGPFTIVQYKRWKKAS